MGVREAQRLESARQSLRAIEVTFAEVRQTCVLVERVAQRLEEIEKELPQSHSLSPIDIWRVREIMAWANWSGTPLEVPSWPVSNTKLLASVQKTAKVLQDRVVSCRSVEGQYTEQVDHLREQVQTLQAQGLGVSPWLEIAPVQLESLPVERSVSPGNYIFLGSLMGVLVGFVWIWWRIARRHPFEGSRIG